ncbi:hypothetical protein VOLCADRAFT_90584 [Volvox carteri f. nagariensis]|uniref:Uncharacterized protein n=1 Tax=Volvox carteri f. nagariensis TaxID=3068 RepID=D8TUT1_VOLCA|nr:uncharacterized protein VOLCADRAFT_90584 [Volvox carteri f. nagariensis]EFJ48763.1 hypothetical protein VOLCADRAFT_90584 [Volvox carteri f. nagariensis]|eukprot:XP_002950095.1 hypothetical protein VOLCADRAFT_90584 [Volvox carteri f. nagariensis]
MGFSCFPCCSAPLVPDDHTELSRAELKRLYDRSIALNGGKLYVHGIFARANTRNNNKRVYPKQILEREVSRFESEHILQGTALGELDHPNYASKYFKCLNLPNVSHQVLEVTWKGDQLWGTIEVLPTPSGLLLRELYSRLWPSTQMSMCSYFPALESRNLEKRPLIMDMHIFTHFTKLSYGVKLGVSSRGWASLRSDPSSKCVFVDDDFELITFDFVTEPSTRGAYLAPVQRRYKRPVPDQSKVIAISHLGHGVVAMEKVARVPGPAVLVQRIADLQRASAAAVNQMLLPGAPLACGPGVLQQVMPPSFKPSSLDNLLCYGHYVVHQSAPYLDREQHARDYRAHLVIFTARAHLADERMCAGTMSRSDIDNVILNKLVTKDAFDPASTSFATRLDQPAARFGGIGGAMGGTSGAGAAATLGADGVGVRMVGGGMAAAAAETQGPPGLDASYAVVHAAAAQRPGATGGDLESWAMHPHVLNANCCAPDTATGGGGGAGAGLATSSAASANQQRPNHAAPGCGNGANGGTAGVVRVLPVVVPASGNNTGAMSKQQAGGLRPGLAACGPGGGAFSGNSGEDEQVRAWLRQLPGGESLAPGFLEIRSSLVSFAELYQLHQKRVEAALLKQALA